MRVEWSQAGDGSGRTPWDAAHAAAGGALQQDWSYGAALETIGATTLRARVYDSDALVALAQFTARRIGVVFNALLCTRGPVWIGDPDAATKSAVYRALKRAAPRARPRGVLFTPDEEAGDIGVKGMTRVMTGYSTVLLDLDTDEEALRAGLHGKWRNRLVAAEASDLKVERNGVKPAQYRWLLDEERKQRRRRGYLAPPVDIAPAFLDAKGAKDAMLILRADESRAPVAAMLFLIHGRAATYQIGWTDDAGRKAGAHNLLLWRALALLRERGARTLDLGGVDTARGAGLARFKIGTGGRVTTLAGTYV